MISFLRTPFIFCLLFFHFSSIPAIAFEKAMYLVKVKAVVQYSKDSTLKHNTPIYEGDTFDLKDGEVIKIVTREKCVGVIYNQAHVQAPFSDPARWYIEGNSIRWICPELVQQRLKLNGEDLLLVGAEVAYSKNHLAVFKGVAYAENPPQDLLPQNAFEKQNHWLKTSENARYRLSWESDLNPPKESIRRFAESTPLEATKSDVTKSDTTKPKSLININSDKQDDVQMIKENILRDCKLDLDKASVEIVLKKARYECEKGRLVPVTPFCFLTCVSK